MQQALQAMVMEPDIGELLGAAIKEIRLRTPEKTQDRWNEATKWSQSYLSAVERGKKGWTAVRRMFTRVEKVGVDPMDIIRIAARRLDADPAEQQLLELWGAMDVTEREALITFLAGRARRPRKRSRARR